MLQVAIFKYEVMIEEQVGESAFKVRILTNLKCAYSFFRVPSKLLTRLLLKFKSKLILNLSIIS